MSTSTLDLEVEISHTLSYLRAYDFLTPLVPPFETLLLEWSSLYQQDRELERGVKNARALIVVVDDDLDALASSLSNILLAELGGNRRSPRYTRYYKEAPSRLVRPVLSDQLATMREWVPSLIEAQNSAPVQAAGQKLAEIVQRADEAVAALGSAKQQQTDFATLGAHKAFIDRLNALRLSTFGQLAEMPHAHRELNLPSGFAQRFFLRDPSEKKPTIPEVEESLLKLKEQQKKLEDLLQKLSQEAAEEARLAEEAEVKEAMKAIEEAEKQRADAERRIEAARAKLAKKKSDD